MMSNKTGSTGSIGFDELTQSRLIKKHAYLVSGPSEIPLSESPQNIVSDISHYALNLPTTPIKLKKTAFSRFNSLISQKQLDNQAENMKETMSKMESIGVPIFFRTIRSFEAASLLSADQPRSPNMFSGNVTLCDDPASVGTDIDGEHREGIEVEPAGKYVDMRVTGDESDSNRNITLTICGATVNENARWYAMGEPRVFDLSVADDETPVVTNPSANLPSIIAEGVQTAQPNVMVLDVCALNIVTTVNLSEIGGYEAQAMGCIGDDVYFTRADSSVAAEPMTYCLQVNAGAVFENCNDGVCADLAIEAPCTKDNRWSGSKCGRCDYGAAGVCWRYNT